LQLGVIDGIIDEPEGGAHENHEGMAGSIKEKLIITLEELMQYDIDDLLEQRYNKFRSMGQFKEA